MQSLSHLSSHSYWLPAKKIMLTNALFHWTEFLMLSEGLVCDKLFNQVICLFHVFFIMYSDKPQKNPKAQLFSASCTFATLDSIPHYYGWLQLLVDFFSSSYYSCSSPAGLISQKLDLRHPVKCTVLPGIYLEKINSFGRNNAPFHILSLLCFLIHWGWMRNNNNCVP